MIRARSIVGLALAAATLTAPAQLIAATGLTGGGPDPRLVPRPPVVDLDAQKMSQAINPPPPQAGNPLWGVPLSSLTVTRERPIFSASRRPPAPPVAARPVVEARTAPPPRGPQRPQLSLVGTVAGAEGIAVFIDQSNQSVVRLRTGEGHDGWVLRTVGPREVTLQNDRDTAVLALPSLQPK